MAGSAVSKRNLTRNTKTGDRYADCRVRTGFAFDRHFCYATGDHEWFSGESRLMRRAMPSELCWQCGRTRRRALPYRRSIRGGGDRFALEVVKL